MTSGPECIHPAPRRGSHYRAGFSLTEALLFAVLGLLVFGGVYLLLTRSVSLSDETSRSLELQIGARNLLENLVADVNSAHVFLEPPGNTTSTLSLVKYMNVDASERLKVNARPAYPFIETDAPMEDLLPVLRTTYVYDEKQKVVVRTVEEGVLASTETTAESGLLSKREFRNGKKIYEKALASSVQQFGLVHCTYDEAGEPVPVEEMDDPDFGKTSFLIVRLRTVFDEGLYASGRRQPMVEISTKIWSYRRLADAMYGEYFSSVDEDARF